VVLKDAETSVNFSRGIADVDACDTAINENSTHLRPDFLKFSVHPSERLLSVPVLKMFSDFRVQFRK